MNKNKKISISISSFLLIGMLFSLLLLPISNASATTFYGSYVEDFNDTGTSFTNTSLWENVTDGINGMLQLNTLTSEFNPSSYPLYDNWTEDASGTNATWTVWGTAFNPPILDAANFVIGSKSIQIPNIATVPFFIVSMTLNPWDQKNLTNYDYFIWYYMDNVLTLAPDSLMLNEIRLTDGNDNYTSITPFRQVSNVMFPLFGKHIEDLSQFSDSDGDSTPFDWSNVTLVEWTFTPVTGAILGIPFINLWFEGVAFIDDYQEYGGFWTSDWINVTDGFVISNILTNTIDTQYITLEISEDNSTWYQIPILTQSNLTYDLLSYNFTDKLLVRFNLTPTTIGNTPYVDYFILNWQPIVTPPDDPPVTIDYQSLFLVLGIIWFVSIAITVLVSIWIARKRL